MDTVAETLDVVTLKKLLAANHKAFELHIAKITELRSKLENEEAKLAFSLYEEKRLLALMIEQDS